MPNITQFDKNTLRILRSEIDVALAQVGNAYGIDLHAGNARFDAKTATFKLDLALLDESGVVETKEMLALKAFNPDMVGKTVTLHRGMTGKVIGYNRRAKAYPYIVETDAGKKFKLSEAQVGALASGAAFIPEG